MKKLKIAVGVLVIGAVLMVAFSPFRYHEELQMECIATTVRIAVPADSLFAWLGNSANASVWSTFVHHITPTNTETHTDGTRGATRRCFANADETGIWWDEEILQVQAAKYRLLKCYHMESFPVSVHELWTEQRYKVISEYETELTFTVRHPEVPDLWVGLKTHFASWFIEHIFEKNLANIKAITEARFAK